MRAPSKRVFQASRNLSVRCVVTSCKPGPECRIPVGSGPGYRTRRKKHALPIVRDEFRPAIPRRVARQHCPSSLHRHHQLKTIAVSKEIIYHRTVTSLLTVCLTPGGNPTRPLWDSTWNARCRQVFLMSEVFCQSFGRCASLQNLLAIGPEKGENACNLSIKRIG